MYSAGPFPDEKARLPAIRIHLSYLNAIFGKLQHRWAVASGVTEGSGVSFQSLQFKRMRHGHWQARRSPVTRPLGWVGGDRMWHDCHDVVRRVWSWSATAQCLLTRWAERFSWKQFKVPFRTKLFWRWKPRWDENEAYTDTQVCLKERCKTY